MLIRMSKLTTFIALGVGLLLSSQSFAQNGSGADLIQDMLSPNGTPAYKMNHEKSICGQTDDREPSYEERVGRVLKRGARAGCTLTMIGRSCAITAGHCKPTFENVHFNTPLSQDGNIQLPDKEDIYQVDSTTVVSTNGGPGNDFAVLRIKRNEITDKLPGDVQGHYDVAFDMPESGDTVRIAGYGQDRADDDRNFAQQVNEGPIANLSTSRRLLSHRVDTQGGSSGSSIIHVDSGKIVGIHTHGGCYSSGGSNKGTLVPAHEEVKEAVKSCLEWEDQNL